MIKPKRICGLTNNLAQLTQSRHNARISQTWMFAQPGTHWNHDLNLPMPLKMPQNPMNALNHGKFT